MILYGSSLSPFVRKVLAFAAEKGIELDVRPIGARRPGTRSSGRPVRSARCRRLRTAIIASPNSSAIIHYLEALHPDPVLIPADPELRGKTIWFDEFADTIVAACGAKMFFNRVVAPRFLNRPGDENAAAAAERDELPPILDYLETVVPGDDGYLVGDTLTLADIAVASPFANLRHLGCQIDRARHPRLLAYVERMLARPSFAPWVEREADFLAKTAA